MRRWQRGIPLPLALSASLFALATSAGADDGGAAALRAEVASLRAALRSERQKIAALSTQLELSAGAGAAPRASRLPPPAGAGNECPKARPPAVWTGLPPGTYNETCTGCTRLWETVTCICDTREAIDPSGAPLAPRGNVTGLWTNALGDGMPGGAHIELRVQELTPNLTSFTVLCLDGGFEMSCNPTVPGKNGTVWRSGRGVASLRTGAAHLFLDNDAVLNGSFDLNFTSANWSNSHDNLGSKWSRLSTPGQRSSISLSACGRDLPVQHPPHHASKIL